MRAKSSIVVAVCCLWVGSLMGFQAAIRPDLNYGYTWTSSLYITISSPQDYDVADFLPTLEAMLTAHQFSIIEPKSTHDIRISTSDPRHSQSPQWSFFGGRDNYLLAEKKAGCLFLLAAMKYTLQTVAGAPKTFNALGENEALETKRHAETAISGYLNLYNKKECNIHTEISQ